jgi:hypothetical protein
MNTGFFYKPATNFISAVQHIPRLPSSMVMFAGLKINNDIELHYQQKLQEKMKQRKINKNF